MRARGDVDRLNASALSEHTRHIVSLGKFVIDDEGSEAFISHTFSGIYEPRRRDQSPCEVLSAHRRPMASAEARIIGLALPRRGFASRRAIRETTEPGCDGTAGRGNPAVRRALIAVCLVALF